MRKGYMLVELLFVIALLIPVAMVMNELFKTVVGDIPFLLRAVNENARIQNVLDQIRRDVDAACALRQEILYTDPNFAGLEPILIEMPDITVCYQQTEDSVIRKIVKPVLPVHTDPNEPDPTQNIWPLDYGKFRWFVRTRDGQGYALEVAAHVEYRAGEDRKKLFAGSQVFFLGAHPQSER